MIHFHKIKLCTSVLLSLAPTHTHKTNSV
jgi:hypothetical protein